MNSGDADGVAEWDAKEVLNRSSRLDLIIKYHYAKHFLSESHHLQFYRELYSSHIRAFNGYFEDSPRKESLEDFLSAFHVLISNMAKHGFSGQEEPLLVNRDAQLIDGAHRLATAASLGLQVPTRVTTVQAPYDDNFFRRKGLSEWAIREAIRLRIRDNPWARLLIAYPIAHSLTSQRIRETASMAGVVIGSVSERRVTLNALANIKRMAYESELHDWIGRDEDGFAGAHAHARQSGGSGKLRVFALHVDSPDALVEAKERLRAEVGVGNFSIHTTDSHAEACALGDVLFSTNGYDLLHRRNAQRDCAKFNSLVDSLSSELRERGISSDDLILVGSAPMGLLAIRAPRDLDFLATISDSRDWNLTCADSHSEYLEWYGTAGNKLIADPRLHYWFRGVKVIATQPFLKMKAIRREWPKDFLDIARILWQARRR